MALITPDRIAFSAHISEGELRERMKLEVLAGIGGLDENGKPKPGIVVEVKRGDSRKGGYHISVMGPMPPQLRLLASS